MELAVKERAFELSVLEVHVVHVWVDLGRQHCALVAAPDPDDDAPTLR